MLLRACLVEVLSGPELGREKEREPEPEPEPGPGGDRLDFCCVETGREVIYGGAPFISMVKVLVILFQGYLLPYFMTFVSYTF